jgi:hypothetical protein
MPGGSFEVSSASLSDVKSEESGQPWNPKSPSLALYATAAWDKLSPTMSIAPRVVRRIWNGRPRPLCANIDETLTAAIIREQGGKEKHRERSQDYGSFWNQFGDLSSSGRAAELPFVAGGACIAFACALGGNWLLRKWGQTSSNGPSPQHHGIVPGSARV